MRYDVIVLGHHFAALAAAGFLARQGRRVGMFTLGEPLDGKALSVRLVDTERRHYRFTMPAEPIGALGEGELFARYLNHLGMDRKLPVLPYTTTQLVRADGRIVRRDHGFAGLRITLIRHYPQSKRAIDRFFTDMQQHHDDYVHQRTQRLLGKPHTLNTLMTHFGTASLDTVLKRYFDDAAVRAEFGNLFTVVGLPLKTIRAVDYFSYWFTVMGTPAYFLRLTYEQLMERLTTEQTYDVITDKVKAMDIERNRVQAVETEDGTRFSAQQFLIAISPDAFVNTYVTREKGFVSETIAPPFRGRPATEYRGTAYVGLKKEVAQFGLETVQTFFESLPDLTSQVLVVTDQTQIDSGAAPAGYGAMQVEYVCHAPLDEAQFRAMLQARIPHIDAAITKVKFGALVPYRGGHHPYYERQKSLRQLDHIDRFEHLKIFDNTWFIGSFQAPERGVTGQLMIGVEMGDLLRTSLDMPTGFTRSIPVEMLIAMATERLDPAVTTGWKKEVAWRIGPRVCTWSFRDGGLTLYHGIGDTQPDVLLSCGLETFVQWAAGTVQSKDILKRNMLGVAGDQTLARQFLNAFAIETLDFEGPRRVLGRVSLLLSILLFVVALGWYTHANTNFLGWLIAGLLVTKMVAQRMLFKNMPWLDVALTGLVLVLFGARTIDVSLQPWVTLSLSLWFIIGFFLPKLGAWPYWFIDHPLAETRWFTKTMGGLNLLYAILFIPLVIGLFLATDMQAFLGVHALILGAFLTRNYPALYARSRIKRRT